MELSVRSLLALSATFWIQSIILPVDAIIGPNVRAAEEFEIPYIVSFLHYVSDNLKPLENHFCTGSLITNQHVLSAAYCTMDRLKNETLILSGTISLMYGNFYYVSWWINYVQWANYKYRRQLIGINDISITKLARPVEDYFESPIAYIHTSDIEDAEAMIAGWGQTNNGLISEALLVGTVKIIPNRKCERRISRLQQERSAVDVMFFCTAADPYILLNAGDFGGPLIYRNKIIGISTETRPFTMDDFSTEKVNIHLNIDFYRTFILETTAPYYEFQ